MSVRRVLVFFIDICLCRLERRSSTPPRTRPHIHKPNMLVRAPCNNSRIRRINSRDPSRMMILHLAEQSPALDVPDAHGFIARGGDDVVRGERDGVDGRAVAEENLMWRECRVEAVDAHGTVCGVGGLAFEL